MNESKQDRNLVGIHNDRSPDVDLLEQRDHILVQNANALKADCRTQLTQLGQADRIFA